MPTIVCPTCSTKLEIDDDMLGEDVQCGSCQEIFKAEAGSKRGSRRGEDEEETPRKSKYRKEADEDEDERPSKRRSRMSSDEDEDDEEDYEDRRSRRRRDSQQGGGQGMGIASLILGILGLIGSIMVCWCCPLLDLPFPILALLFGFLSLKTPGKGMGIGGMVTHLGIGVSMLGLIVSRGLEQMSVGPTGDPNDRFFVISPTAESEQMGYRFKALGRTSDFVDRHNKVRIAVTGRNEKFVVTPGLYFTGISPEGKPTPMIWPSIHSKGWFDLYLVLYDISFEASGGTIMKVGDSRLLKDEKMLVTYNGLRTEGALGQPGTKFFAKVTVSTAEGKWDVEPMLTMGKDGLEKTSAKIDDKWKISLEGMNVGEKSVTLQVKYVEPAYIAELFYKPLTILVWWGIGIMTVGAGLTAWTRRLRPKEVSEPKATDPEPDTKDQSQE